MVQLVRLMVLGAVVLGTTVLMALPRRAQSPAGEPVASNPSEAQTVARGGTPPAPRAPSNPGTQSPPAAPTAQGTPVDTKPIVAPSKAATTPAPQPATAPVAAAGPRSHTIASGDTLQKISKRYYGSFSKWRRIADANPGVDPTRLRPGQKLVIP